MVQLSSQISEERQRGGPFFRRPRGLRGALGSGDLLSQPILAVFAVNSSDPSGRRIHGLKAVWAAQQTRLRFDLLHGSG
jgi:hypothetical protein